MNNEKPKQGEVPINYQLVPAGYIKIGDLLFDPNHRGWVTADRNNAGDDAEVYYGVARLKGKA